MKLLKTKFFVYHGCVLICAHKTLPLLLAQIKNIRFRQFLVLKCIQARKTLNLSKISFSLTICPTCV